MEHRNFKTLTKTEWLECGLTLEEIEKVDDRGFIKTYCGIDLYLDRNVVGIYRTGEGILNKK